MKQGVQLNLQNVGSNDTLEAGRIEIDDDKYAPYLECKVTANIANASGAAVAMNDAQRQAFLTGYKLHLWDSAQSKRKAIDGKTLDVLDAFARYCGGGEWQGYGDATTGLAQSIPNGQTKAVVFWVRIPLGHVWFLKETEGLFGVGPTQAKTLKIKAERVADTLPASCTISGTVTIEVRPAQKPAHGRNPWTYFPELLEVDEAREKCTVEGGLFIGAFEMTNPRASCTLSNIRVTVGKKVIHDGIPESETVVEYLEPVNVPTTAVIGDRYSELYVIPLGTKLKDLPAGNFQLYQIKKDMATVRALGFFFPLRKREDVESDLNFAVSSKAQNRPLRAVSMAEVAPALSDLPDALRPFVPMVLIGQDDPGFDTYAGLLASPSTPAHVDVPPTVQKRANDQINGHKGNGDHIAAEAIKRRVAASIPGAVQSPDGFDGGDSTVLAEVRQKLAA